MAPSLALTFREYDPASELSIESTVNLVSAVLKEIKAGRAESSSLVAVSESTSSSGSEKKPVGSVYS